IKRPREMSLVYVSIYGVIFGVGLWWLVNYAMYNGLAAGVSSVFLQFSAFFTIILSAFIFGEKINKVHAVGMIVSFLGLVMMITSSDDSSTIYGIFLVILAALAWALCNMIVKMKKPSDMVGFIVWSSIFSAPSVLILTVIAKGWGPIISIKDNISFASAFSVLFQAYITTVIGYMIWNNLMKKYPATEIAPLSLFVPVSGLTASFFLLDEKLSVFQLIAVVVVCVGIFIFLNASRIKKWINL
ncbi:EamA family transporter, partial [Escherichia coli]|nr:EamA family transporter [Escherichia coli]EEC8235527.1 EamA family transporter [Escherichia coli]EEQ3927237.1 EamA family transporter [Escherichia coli]EEQ9876819.1 EamA family transporter [Escherichia coli]EER1737249.1 EamA family transporter [Escherichia coli]